MILAESFSEVFYFGHEYWIWVTFFPILLCGVRVLCSSKAGFVWDGVTPSL